MYQLNGYIPAIYMYVTRPAKIDHGTKDTSETITWCNLRSHGRFS